MEFLIEKATTENIDEILDLFENSIKTACSKDYNQRQIIAWTSSRNDKERWKLKIANQYFIVVKHQNTIVGFGSLEDDYLDFLFVHPKYLRKGIASLIYDTLKFEATNSGFKKLTVFASITAKPFFLSKEFKIIKEKKILRKGIEITNFEMRQ